jgi:hypothetical protein
MFSLNDVAFLAAVGAPAYDPDAQTYITAVEAADTQALEVGVKDAINAFVVGCKADGIWAAIKASCILAGARTLTGALVPLVGAAPTNFNFVAGDYNRKTGLVGDGSTKYLDSNRNNNADPQNSKHVGVYVTAAPSATSALIGAREGQGSENGSSQVIHVNNVSSNFRINTATFTSDSLRISAGLAACTRTGASAENWRHSAGRTGTSTVASQTPFSINIHVFQRAGSSGNVPTNARLAFYSIGESLDLALLDARVTALINAIAAAIP